MIGTSHYKLWYVTHTEHMMCIYNLFILSSFLCQEFALSQNGDSSYVNMIDKNEEQWEMNAYV